MGAYNMFTDLKDPRDVTKYTLFRGTTDFTQLQQFDLYESGYPYLVPCWVRSSTHRGIPVESKTFLTY